MTVCLCLLTYNELVGSKEDVPQIERDAFDQIIAIDGGSTDGTVEYLKEQNIPVHKQPIPSLNAACHFAVEQCKTDAIIFFHPKGTIPVADTLKFRPLFDEGYAFIVASRMTKHSTNEEDSSWWRPRKWFTMGLGLGDSIVFRKDGNKVLDVLHGFRGVTVEAFKAMQIKAKGVTVDQEMTIRSYQLSLKRIEFPTHEKPRLAGETHFPALPTGWKHICHFAKETIQQFSSGSKQER